jgi:hypothetical protein
MILFSILYKNYFKKFFDPKRGKILRSNIINFSKEKKINYSSFVLDFLSFEIIRQC